MADARTVIASGIEKLQSVAAADSGAVVADCERYSTCAVGEKPGDTDIAGVGCGSARVEAIVIAVAVAEAVAHDQGCGERIERHEYEKHERARARGESAKSRCSH